MSYLRTGGSYSGDRMHSLGSNLPDVNWRTASVVASQWNYYKPQPDRSDAEIAEWLRAHHITLYGERVPQPMLAFPDLAAPDAVHQSFLDLGFTAPTAIQSMAWPILLHSRDLVGVARTGSGKTMAFMVPAALHVLAQPPLRPGDGPVVLVLAPTRELAAQMEAEARGLLRRLPGIATVCVYGGAPKGGQVRALRAGAHVCIATPGRLIDLLEMRATSLMRVTYLVLDEADRMLDMGFEEQIRKICAQVRPDRQTLMFSATWPQEIRNLAASFQRDFIRVHVGSEELVANRDVRQHVLVVEEYDKQRRLEEILQRLGQQRVLIFVKTKRTADALHHTLRRMLGSAVMVIHGDKEQTQRDFVIDRFRRDDRSVLVATDVAARGLDIKNLDVVINFDMPTNIEDYVHRIGRTGRAGQTGDAYSFVSGADPSKTLRDLSDILRRANQSVPPELLDLCARGGRGAPRYGGGASFARSFHSPRAFHPVGAGRMPPSPGMMAPQHQTYQTYQPYQQQQQQQQHQHYQQHQHQHQHQPHQPLGMMAYPVGAWPAAPPPPSMMALQSIPPYGAKRTRDSPDRHRNHRNSRSRSDSRHRRRRSSSNDRQRRRHESKERR